MAVKTRNSFVIAALILGGVVFVGIRWWTQTSLSKVAASAVEDELEDDAILNQDSLQDNDVPDLSVYFGLTATEGQVVDQALQEINRKWHPGSTVMLIEISRFARSRESFGKILGLLEARTGNRFGADLNRWYDWIWSQDYQPHPQYTKFKSDLYSKIDSRFVEYFQETENAKIRLDEIRWGGVARDGIPPLKNPKMISADEADYLADTDVVFGIELNGDSRCYPKRILAWHEMFKDTIGGESVCGVY